MNKIDILYQNALKQIMNQGLENDDKRLFHRDKLQNKSKTKALPGMLFEIDLEKDGLPILSLRKIPVKLFVAESIWFLVGHNKTEPFFKKYSKIWESFTEEDGTVTSYGYRWRKHFGRDQILGALEMLKKDPTSRHGVVITWDPATDSLLNGVKRLNVPCQIGFMLNIIDNKLNFHSIWRSVDMILGFPHDIAGNSILAHIFAAYLGVKVEKYFHYIANAHIYNIHYDIAEELINRKTKQGKIKLKAESEWFDRASNGDHDLVSEIMEIINSQYTNYGDPIKGIKIVV